MKKLAFFIIVLPCLLSPINSFSQTTKLNFTTEITSTENVPIPDVYIKIYLPEIVYAVDSFFTDGEGKTEKELSINFGTGLPFFKAGKEAFFITKALSPNIASSKISNYFLEYSHQKEGRLNFMDVQGRIYPNHTELEAGIYFYFLDFEDGQKSELNKFIVSEKCVLNVGLRNNKQSQQNQPNNSRKSELENRIIIEVLKDGFITQKDTIPVETTEIERNYQLEFAMLPTAGFSWSGELKVGKPVIFDASSSYGANAESLVYSWDFGDRLKGQSAGIPHVYSNPGEYLVKLTVRGDFGAKHSLSKTISIEASATAVHSDGIINAYINDEDGTSLENVKLSLVEEEMEGFTNENGVAYLAGLPVGIPVHLKITKDDYVNQMVEVTVPEDSKQADIFISLKSRMPAILLSNAEFGGDVMGIEGAKLKLPVEALVKQDGSVAKGDVTVNVTPIDVAFEAESFPGSFEAFRDDGEDGVLLSYGVSEFHFKQGEEELQLAEGKTAIVHIPIYTGGATLGDEIPLWSVNEENGKWMQEGTGRVVSSLDSPTGLALEAEVGHFSWWNCDDFQDDRKRKGLCWRWECTTAQCYKVKVGCWMSGAQQGSSSGSKKSVENSQISQEDRLNIPPVFEVREYVPETGTELRFPSNRDVYVEARSFNDEGELFSGNYTVIATDEADTFEIELISVLAGDTTDLALNSLYEDYLEPGQLKYYRIDIPEKQDYRIYFEKGPEPALSGMFYAFDNQGELLSGNIDQSENIVNINPGEMFISVTGLTEFSEGNFVIGLSELDPVLPGDTIDMALNSTVSGTLGISEFIHYRLTIPEEGLYRVDMPWPEYPILQARFIVSKGDKTLRKGIVNTDADYFFTEPGEIIISVGGKLLSDEGNYKLEVYAMDTNPIEINDSLYVSVSADAKYKIFSFHSDNNTVLKTRYYLYESTATQGSIKLISPDGKILNQESIYTTEGDFFTSMVKDSIYYFEVSTYNDLNFVLINEEKERLIIEYGDTINEQLSDKGEVDAYHFHALQNDMISIKGNLPDTKLNGAYFELWNEEGMKIATRRIEYYYGNYDYEVFCKIPEDGEYSVIVKSTYESTGSYRIILDTVACSVLNINSFTELDVIPGSDYYFELDVPDNIYGHFSILSDNSNGGNFILWDQDATRLSPKSLYRNFSNYFNASYSNIFNQGKIYCRLSIASANKVYINYVEPGPLSFNEKGKSMFGDTIKQKNQVNAYYFNGSPGDGVHGILKESGTMPAPEKLILKYYPMFGGGEPLITNSAQISYYTNDSTILDESGATLTGETEDTVWVLIAHAGTAGLYHFNFHMVKSSNEIKVDDDFVEYPDAQTSSHIAAGYAVKDGGNIFIASGNYSSYLPLRVESRNVVLSGQGEENTFLSNVKNEDNYPVAYFNSEGGKLSDMSISCGRRNYDIIEYYKPGVELDQITIKPLPGQDEVSGGIRGSGDNSYIHNLTIENSLWGINVNSNAGIIEDCNIQTKSTSVRLFGDNTIIRNNIFEVGYSARCIELSCNTQNIATQIIENNQITIPGPNSASDNGVIVVDMMGVIGNTGVTYVRNNTIQSAALNSAFYIKIGYPSGRVFVENNTYKCTNTRGGKAFMLQSARTDGSSGIIVRNNTFDGLTSWEAIGLYGVESIPEGQYFAISNNNFRIAAGATMDPGYNFIGLRHQTYDFKDTARVYIVNNIFEGNGSGYFAKFNDDFSIYSDYNLVYNFSNYIGDQGSLIGTSNDQTGDPLYIDDNLHIGAGSPAINNGASVSDFNFIPLKDYNGTLRPQGVAVDIGAYEKIE